MLLAEIGHVNCSVQEVVTHFFEGKGIEVAPCFFKLVGFYPHDLKFA